MVSGLRGPVPGGVRSSVISENPDESIISEPGDDRGMERNSVKKMGVIATTVVIVALFMTLPVFYYVVEMPVFAVGIAALVYIILAIAMVYYAVERFREIDEGLDDAVDDY